MDEPDLKNMSPEQIKDLQKQNCIFCHIINNKVPAQKIHESKHFIAILDINPAAKGHLLMVSKEHISIMQQLSKEQVAELAIITKKLSNAMLSGLRVEGTTVFAASGPAAGQKAPHFFMHLIPRKDKDNLLPTKVIEMKEADLEKLKHVLVGK